jgi:hypothetical protein
MSLIVQKYGGTSVGTPDRIVKVAGRILQAQRTGNQVVAVVSAMSGVTDNLIKLASQVAPQPTEREMDVLLATGEQTTIALTAMAINGLGGRAVSLTGAQAGIGARLLAGVRAGLQAGAVGWLHATRGWGDRSRGALPSGFRRRGAVVARADEPLRRTGALSRERRARS